MSAAATPPLDADKAAATVFGDQRRVLRFCVVRVRGGIGDDGAGVVLFFRFLGVSVAEVTLYWTPSVPGELSASPWILWLGGHGSTSAAASIRRVGQDCYSIDAA